MDKNILYIAIAIIIGCCIIAAGCYLGLNSHDDSYETNNTTNNTTKINITEDDKSSSSSSDSKSDDGVVSEEVKFNYQAGEGYYREVEYADGNMRQYDTQTGELIGSTYQSDQKYLPSME